jgi:hypothetical protein
MIARDAMPTLHRHGAMDGEYVTADLTGFDAGAGSRHRLRVTILNALLRCAGSGSRDGASCRRCPPGGFHPPGVAERVVNHLAWGAFQSFTHRERRAHSLLARGDLEPASETVALLLFPQGIGQVQTKTPSRDGCPQTYRSNSVPK